MDRYEVGFGSEGRIYVYRVDPDHPRVAVSAYGKPVLWMQDNPYPKGSDSYAHHELCMTKMAEMCAAVFNQMQPASEADTPFALTLQAANSDGMIGLIASVALVKGCA